jgi:release factor glutamine methyltransferase
MTLRHALRDAAKRLASAGVDAPRLSAQLLACRALGCPRLQLELRAENRLSPAQTRIFTALTDRRALGEPVALLLGEKEFYSRPFAVNSATLVPRPESELLVELALSRLPAEARVIADFGTGAGCLGVTLCAERPAWRALLIDNSPAALRAAATNAVRHGARGRAFPVLGDFCRPLLRAGGIDCIVANPPYVSEAEYAGLSHEIRNFEPRAALLSGPSGLDHLRAIALFAREALKPGGRVFAEFGARQGEAVKKMFSAAGWAHMRVHTDLAGRERCLEAARAERAPAGGTRKQQGRI